MSPYRDCKANRINTLIVMVMMIASQTSEDGTFISYVKVVTARNGCLNCEGEL